MEQAAVRDAPVARKVRAFGPDNSLIRTLTDAQGGASNVGAILWGLGIAEVKTARRLAKKGIASFQVRINGSAFEDDRLRNDLYARHGVAFNKAAMDEFSSEREVDSFILMGNCAAANICLNAAIADPRVVGLILTNPYVNKRQLLSSSLSYKLRTVRTWKRLFSGDIDLRRNFRIYLTALAERFERVGPSSAAAAPVPAPLPDFELPERLDDELRKLGGRGVRLLIACATSDDSIRYLPAKHGSVLNELRDQKKLLFESVEGGTHVFSTNDDAAQRLNDAISRWLESTTFGGAR